MAAGVQFHWLALISFAAAHSIRANPDAIAYLLSEAELLEPQALE